MNKLVLVDGHSGAGKTTVSTFIESLGFIKYSFDDYITEVFSDLEGYKSSKHVDDLRIEGEKITNFWKNFKRSRKYSFESAADILTKYKTEIEAGLKIPEKCVRIYLEAFWNGYFDIRDISLLSSNVVMDTVAGHVAPFILSAKAEKYHISLRSERETAIQRKINQYGWDRKTAEDVVDRTSISGATPKDVILLEYLNESRDDLERIKTDLKEKLG